jgi:hypothetical protein
MSELFDLKSWCKMHGIKTRMKRSSFWVRALGRICRPFDGGLFMRRVTTIGDTIWLPDNFAQENYAAVMRHELVHVKQFQKFGWFFIPLYLFFPLPIFFAYFRWKFEREAYAAELRSIFGERKVPHVTLIYIANALSEQYARPWPVKWMIAWFEKELNGA